MRVRLLVAAIVELAYALGTRTLLRQSFDGIPYELALTACRLVTLLVYIALFRDLLRRPARRPTLPASPALLTPGLVALFAVPLLFYGGYPADPAFRAVFAATSLVVGLREEVLYRGVVQALVERRAGLPPALLASNGLFLLFHIGAQPMTVTSVVEILSMGCVLGILFSATGSLRAPVVVHVLYDALWSLSPVAGGALADRYRPLFIVAGLAFVILWVQRLRRATRDDP